MLVSSQNGTHPLWKKRCWLHANRCRQDTFLLDTSADGSGGRKRQDELCCYTSKYPWESWPQAAGLQSQSARKLHIQKKIKVSIIIIIYIQENTHPDVQDIENAKYHVVVIIYKSRYFNGKWWNRDNVDKKAGNEENSKLYLRRRSLYQPVKQVQKGSRQPAISHSFTKCCDICDKVLFVLPRSPNQSLALRSVYLCLPSDEIVPLFRSSDEAPSRRVLVLGACCIHISEPESNWPPCNLIPNIDHRTFLCQIVWCPRCDVFLHASDI